MPRPRFHKLPEEKKHQILEATARELAEHGYEGASMNRILVDAGLSKGAAYYYFDDKQDLIITVVLHYWNDFMADRAFDLGALTRESYWESIEALSTQLVTASRETPWLATAAKALWSLPPGARAEGPAADAFRQMIDWLSALLARGRDLGVVRGDLPADLLLGLVVAIDEAADRWILVRFEALSAEELARIGTLVFDLWKRLLVPAAGGAADGR